MATRLSAGVVLYRRKDDRVEVLLGHMGGPFWSAKDAGAWSIPKGEYSAGDDPFAAALREFEEEIGLAVPAEHFVDLGEQRQSGGKRLTVWAAEGDLDPARAVSNTFQMEWPRGSGRIQEFPEIDRAEWFDVRKARNIIVSGQIPFLDRLVSLLET